MRRLNGLFIPPEILSDARLEPLDMLLAVAVHSDDTGQGSAAINEDLAELTRSSVSKVKQSLAKLITLHVLEVVAGGNKRFLFSKLGQYMTDRRVAPAADPDAAGSAPANGHPPALNLGPDTPAGIVNNLFGEAVAVEGEDTGPAAADIYAEYPRKIERKEAIKRIEQARARLAKRLKQDGEPNPVKRAAEILLERTRWYAQRRAREIAAGESEPKFTPYAQRWYKNDHWESEDDPNGTAHPNPCQPIARRPRTAAERGQYAESNEIPTEPGF
jgi:hypothetical protein